MKELIWKTFVKDHENIKDPEVRNRYTKLTGTLGIIVNTLLCVIKIVMGLLINSIAVIGDGLHDLADSMAAVITLIGARIARKPANKEHPYGHARVEYLTSLIVSAIVLIVAYELMTSSIDKVMHPGGTEFSWLTVGFLALAVIIKGSSALFIIATGKHINSLPVVAAGTDNRNDVISSIIIIIGMFIQYFTGFELDGYLGCLVALFIFYSGFELIKETVSPLLGEKPDPELVSEMYGIIMENPVVNGVHDLMVYDYGPGKLFTSFHAEVDAEGDIMEIHDNIDNLEKEIYDRMGMVVTCHMDPIDYSDPIRDKMIDVIAKAIVPIDGVESFHDLRVVPGTTHTNIIFDLVMTPGSKADHDKIKEELQKKVTEADDKCLIVINFDDAYV
ncbi:MAG: cation diffusion facilitator family transporter [Clostridia bacterium]|nr:cation diffusion facilitator family transporter [Clostridia bacterium]